MRVYDLFNDALISGRLEREARGLAWESRFAFLDMVSRAGMWDAAQAEEEPRLKEYLCIPCRHKDGELELCYISQRLFDRFYRPAVPDVLDALERDGISPEERTALRRKAIRPILLGHRFLVPPVYTRGVFEPRLLMAQVPDLMGQTREEVAVQFVYMMSGALKGPLRPGEVAVKVIDPLERAIARERAMLKVYLDRVTWSSFDEAELERACRALPGDPDRPMVLLCADAETEHRTVRSIEESCRGLCDLGKLPCRELNSCPAGRWKELAEKDLVLITGFTGLVLDEKGEELLRRLVRARVPLVVTADPEEEVGSFYGEDLCDLFASAVEYKLNKDR